MVQINEAHSLKWKIGRYHPLPQHSFEDRLNRANQFVMDEKVPYPTYVDGWNDEYDNTYHAWPDRYFLVDKDKKLIATSEYGKDGDMDGTILLDCTDLLQKLLL
jgi:hypothetical protein